MRDPNYEREAGEPEEPALFPGAAGSEDRALIFQEEAAAIAGCTVAEFLIGVQAGMFPQWEGFPDPKKAYAVVGVKPNGRPRWRHRPRWRRGLVIAAVDAVHKRAAPMLEPRQRQSE